jgi:hypothetical protein
MDLIKDMSNQQIFNSLKNLKLQTGPVTSETRSVYEKKLLRILECQKNLIFEEKKNSNTDSDKKAQAFYEDEIIQQLKKMSLNTN